MHSQGSLLHNSDAFERDEPHEAKDRALGVDVPELSEMRFADNETLVPDKLELSDPVASQHLDSADGQAKLAGTDIADIALVIKDDSTESGLEELAAGKEGHIERLDVSVEVDISETHDVNSKLEEVPQIPKLVLDGFTEVSASLMISVNS